MNLITAQSILRMGFVALAVGLAGLTSEARAKNGPAQIDWDQVENVKSAAARIGRVQRSKGADVAMNLISNCYKTHTLFLTFSRGFESCLVQDHLQTRILVEVYGRLQPEALKRIGAPSKEVLVNANVTRFAASVAKYKLPKAYAHRIRKLADEHGWPVFVAIVFPELGAQQHKSKPKKQIKRKR